MGGGGGGGVGAWEGARIFSLTAATSALSSLSSFIRACSTSVFYFACLSPPS